MSAGIHQQRSPRIRPAGRKGGVSIHLLALLVPVVLGMMGFAFDLGRLYVVRNELKVAANAMALAAAQKLIGTDASLDAANTNARLTLNNAGGAANKYDFGGLEIGQVNGTLASEAPDPAYFSTVADATSADAATGAGVGGSLARHARVQITADAPLVFWSFLPLAAERKVTITASAVAGISPPLCVACGILPIAVAAADQTDATDFGFIAGTRYTLAFQCTGTPPPPALGGTSGVIPYLLLNRLNSSATVFTDEQSQLFRIGAGGLPGSAQQAQACFTVNAAEQIWATATPAACNLRVANNSVVSMLCGLSTRFESTLQTVCSTIPEVDSISAIFQPDSDTADLDDYTQYTGTGRRILTLPVVDVLTPAGDMTVLGFRQFFFEPNSGATNLTASDPYSRFVVMYAGSVAPVPQGSFAGCQQTAGPGKVVLHQ